MSSVDDFFNRWKLGLYALIYALMWTQVACLWQGGWQEFMAFWSLYWKLSLIAVLLTAMLSSASSGPTNLLAFSMGSLGVLWLAFAGSFASWKTGLADLLAIAIAGGAAYFVMGWLTRRRDPQARTWRSAAPAHLQHLDVVVFGLLSWCVVSLVSVLTTRPLPTDPTRFSRLGPEASIVKDQAKRWNGLNVGLALSGGGYRAAVFHSGVLQALEKLGVQVTNLSTVSGGSVIGAYYAVGGEPAAFPCAVAEGRFNLKRRLMLIHNALRLPFPFRVPGLDVELFPWRRFDRLDAQTALLDDLLFAESRLHGGLQEEEPELGQPKLMITATDLRYGFQLGLLPEGALVWGEDRVWALVERHFEPDHRFTLAERVAVSGAFPIAFPSRSMSGTFEGIPDSFQLVDGGIRDNTGFELLHWADTKFTSHQGGLEPQIPKGWDLEPEMPNGWDLDAIFVSDAGAVVEVAEDSLAPLAMLPRLFDVSALGKGPVGADPGIPVPLSDKPSCASLINDPIPFTTRDVLVRPEEWARGGISSRDDDNAWSIGLDPTLYPVEVRGELLALLPEPRKAAAKKHWDRYLELHRNRVEGVHERDALTEIVRQTIREDFEVFRQASTLEDSPDAATVDAVEHLGKFLVYYRWPFIKRNLDTARECRDRHIPRP